MYFEELAESIKKDLLRDKLYDRYPVRFFGMNLSSNSANELLDLKNTLNKVSEYPVEIVDIQKYLPHENGWINADRFINIIYGLEKDKSYIVVGFSEYARFLSKETFFTILLSLLELENDGVHMKRRIYFSCFSLFNQIKGFIKENHRRKDVYNPLLLAEADGEELPRMFFIDSTLKNIDFENEIQTSKEWFSIWRNSHMDISKPIICTSKTLFYFYGEASPDNVYNIKCITLYKDVVASLYNIHGIVEYQSESDEYMIRLIKLLNNNRKKSFKNIILKELNTQVLDQDNIYVIWKDADKFKRWLIQNYFILYGNKDSYIYTVLSKVELLTVDELKEKIFEYSEALDDENKVLERRKIINKIKNVDGNVVLSARIEAYYENLLRETIRKQTTILLENIDFNQDYDFSSEQIVKISSGICKSLIPLVTDSSVYERKLSIWLYRAGFLNKSQVEKMYPAFFDYLFAIESFAVDGDEQNKFDGYFLEYRKCRSLKSCEKNYDDIIELWNANEEKFYSWYTSGMLRYPEKILKDNNFQGPVYVIDGLSAEFMGYLAAMLKKAKMDIQHMEYSKVHLPTITSTAKKYYNDSYKWITDYDRRVVHGIIYYHVDNIESSLTCIENIVTTIINESGENGFAIIADHGVTAGHKISKKSKKYNFENSDHDGRCCLLNEGEWADNEKEYTVYTNPTGENWILSLTNQSLYNSSQYEVHGGATPEEVIVPVIIAKRSTASTVKYKVIPEKLKVSGLDKLVSVKVRPIPESVQLTAKDGTNCKMKYDENKKEWVAFLKRGIAQNIDVSVGKQKFTFKTIPSTKMGGNDGFDD